MIDQINVVKLASQLADEKLSRYAESLNESDYKFEFPNGLCVDVDDETLGYTDEAQELFDEYYDEYFDMILNCKDK